MRRHTIVCLLLASSLSHAWPAWAQEERARAIEHFERGNGYLAEGALDAALAELTLSRELLKTRGNTLNLAIVLQRLGRYDEALAMYRELLTTFALEAADKERVEREIESLVARVGSLVLECEPDARVYVDGRERGTTPLVEPLVVSAGSRVVRVVKAGRIPFEERIVVSGGRELRLRIELPRLVERVVVREQIDGQAAVRPPRAPREPRPPRVAWGVDLAGFAGSSLGGPLRAVCGADCESSLALGYGAHARGGIAFDAGFELAATLGWLSLSANYSGRDDTVDVGGPQSGTSDDELQLSGVLVGARASVTRGDTPFLRVALSAGGLFGKVRDERNSRFTIQPAGSPSYSTSLSAERSVTANYLFVLPELLAGWRLTQDLEASAGLGLLALFAVTTPRWPENDALVVTGGPAGNDLAFPENDALTGSLLFCLSPRLGVSGRF